MTLATPSRRPVLDPSHPRADRDGPTERLEHVFSASVARSPDAVAVEDGPISLTYAELDRHVDHVVREIRRHGVGLGGRVGILLPRSWRTYAVLIAVLRSGAAFVPIDPASPADRVGYITDDAGLDVLVTTRELAGRASGPAIVIEDVPTDDQVGPDDIGEAPAHEPDALAYVIYTSGSSGRPKGVAVEHRSIANFVDVITGVYDVRDHDRVYQGMTISFDFSIEEIWPTFAAGATLVVGPDDSRRIGAELGDFLADARVTVFCCVPTLLATIPRDLPDVRTLLVGGEACNAGLVERWARPGRRMLNTYGPTETTVTCTWGELLPGRPVTIGRPVPTYSAVVLDDTLREVPAGGTGEICIGGPGVARGYVNLPDKTADRFVRHPAAPSNGDGRLYRTGDLGRFDENGEIVYLGRADDEVKIRGHRVDLGEIENVALEDADVEGAVAALSTDGEAEELVLYVVAADPARAVDREVLHDLLRTRQPEYMVPGYIEVLDALPTQVSGKVDRSTLPAPVTSRMTVVRGPVAEPRTPDERRVRDSLAAVLGLDPGSVSVEADFFAELGGHSLLAARAINRLRADGVGDPAVRDLYLNPTVRELAAELGRDHTARSTSTSRRSELLSHTGIRYGLAAALQGGALYALLFVLTVPAAVVYALNDGRITVPALAELAVGATAVYVAMRWLFIPFLVRLLERGVEPGVHPLWSVVHLQLWASDLLLTLSPLRHLAGSPLAAPYLRMLGARVGRGTHVGSSALSQPSQLHIGDDAGVGNGAALRPWALQDGWVVVAPVSVGARAHVGANSVLEPGAVVGDDAVLGDQSSVARHQRIGDGEHWAGAPSAPHPVDAAVVELADAGPAPAWTRRGLAAAVTGLVTLEALSIATLVPAVALVWSSLIVFGQGPALAVAVLAGPVYVLTVCAVVAIGRRLVVPRDGPGLYPARTVRGVRRWFGDKLLEMSLDYTNSLYATLYAVGWLRLLGVRVGRGAEVSTAAHLDPDLLTIGDGSFVADMASLGGATYHRGWLLRRATTVGRRSFVGNAAVLPAGTEVGDGSLIGVATVPPVGAVPDDSNWLGSPPMHLPVREDSGTFDESLTFRPSRRRVAERLGIEFLRATLPASAISVSLYLFLFGLSSLAMTSATVVVAVVAPVLALLTGLCVLAAVAVVKWTVIGTYRPRVDPLWSRFVRRSEFVTGLYEAAAVPALVGLLVGTPMLPPALRLLGARIGRRTCLATTYVTEFDLVDIGDDACVGRDVSLQTHLFEDRVMKMSRLRIGDRASVGDRSVVLYDATVGDDAALDPLSLLMKGEQLAPRSRARGIPSEGISR